MSENRNQKPNDEAEAAKKGTQTHTEESENQSIHSDNIGEYALHGLSGIFAAPLVSTKSSTKSGLSNRTSNVPSKTNSIRSKFSVKVRTIRTAGLISKLLREVFIRPSVCLFSNDALSTDVKQKSSNFLKVYCCFNFRI